MDFQWDAAKNEINRKKHGISFELATLVFSDPLAVSRSDTSSRTEQRRQIIGQVQGVQQLLVVYTARGKNGEEQIRVISARKATAQERRQYENCSWFSQND